MDFKIFLSAFSAVFFAELGDKTQIAALSLSAKSRLPLSVFAGSVSAYVVITLATVLLGGILAKYIKPEYIRYGSACIFIVIGIAILAGKA